MKLGKETALPLSLVTVLGIGFPATAAQAAPPLDLIVNGDFETGDLTGWTTANTDSAQVTINDGSFDPRGDGGPLPPISGAFDAVTDQTGSALASIEQMIDVPANVLTATLSWNDRVRNYAGQYADPGQEWRVEIRNESDTVVFVAFSTNPGDDLIQVGPNSRSADITAVLQAHEGQTLTVSFEQQAQLFYMNATLDDVSLLVSTLPADKGDCKKGGWKTFVNVSTGRQIFRNQGDCVSFVASQGKNPPASF